MPVYCDKKTKRLFIQFRLKGTLYKERLPATTTRKEAETLEIKIKSQMLFEAHGIDTDRRSTTFERFVQDDYLPYVENNHSNCSFEKSIIICKSALKFFKGKQLRHIKPADIERFKQYRSELKTMHGKHRAAATVARELSIISKVFSMAVRNDLCDYNPCSRVEKPKFDNVQDRILRRQDEQKFFDNMHSEWAKDICRMVLNCGLRQNDLMRLTRFQVDLENGWIRLTQGKTKRRVDLKINSVMAQILEKRIERYKRRADGLLFPSPRKDGVNGSVRHAIQRACKRAKIPQLTIRDLRRTFGTRIQPFTDTVTAARMLGHSDLRSIHRYQRSLEMIEKASEMLADSAIYTKESVVPIERNSTKRRR